MTDRLEEIERRLKAAMDVKYPSGEGASGPELSIFYAHCYGDNGDIAFLLGEVRRLRARTHELSERADMSRKAIASNVDACRAEGISLGRVLANAYAHDVDIERDEAQSLALSLADALEKTPHSPVCAWVKAEVRNWPCDCHRSTLSDERLTKLREMMNV